MKMKKIYLAVAIAALTLTSCKEKAEQQIETTLEELKPEGVNEEAPKENTEKDTTVLAARALSQKFVNLDGQQITVQQILDKHKGQSIFIDVWASWCPDCLKAVPNVTAIKNEFTSTVFVNLSLDKTEEKWKKSIAKHEIGGEHYFSLEGEGMKGEFGKSLDLNWIPRYIIIDKEGKVALYNATEKNFEEIKDLLKKIQ